MMRSALLFGSILSLFCGVSAYRVAAQSQVSQNWATKAEVEIPPAIDRYQGALKHAHEEATLITSSEPADKVSFRPRTVQVTSNYLDANCLIQTAKFFNDSSSNKDISVKGDNKDYSFVLSQKPSGQFVLTNHSSKSNASNDNVELSLSAIAYQDLRIVLKGLKGDGEWRTSELRQLPNLQLYAIVEQIERDSKQQKRRYELWIETSSQWRIIKRVIHTQMPIAQRLTTTIEYGNQLGDISFPKSYVEEVAAQNAPVRRIDVSIALTRTTKSEDDFRLSAFGLPEPVDAPPPPSRTPRYVWFLAAAVGFAVLALVFRRLTRHRNPPAAPEGNA